MLAACLSVALRVLAIASSPEFNPRAPIPDGGLALVRGSNQTATQPSYCDDLQVNNGGQGAVAGHRGCIGKPPGTICVMRAVTANSPTNIGGVGPLIKSATVNCNTDQQDKFFGECDGNVSCGKLSFTGAELHGQHYRESTTVVWPCRPIGQSGGCVASR